MAIDLLASVRERDVDCRFSAQHELRRRGELGEPTPPPAVQDGLV